MGMEMEMVVGNFRWVWWCMWRRHSTQDGHHSATFTVVFSILGAVAPTSGGKDSFHLFHLLEGNKGSTRFSPNTPFTPEILTFPLPDRFKYPRIKEYDGTIDPINYLNVYTDVMNLQVAPDQVMCKTFPQTLTNAARDWKIGTSLMQLRQGQNETLRDFMTRFNKERLQILDLHITAAVFALTYAIKCEALKMSLSKTLPKTMIELLTRVEKYINMEETLNLRKVGPSHDRVEHKRPHDPNPRQEPPWRKQRQEVLPMSFTRLNMSKTNILMEIKDMKELNWPARMRSPPESRDMNTYCEFHRDHGHTTENCKALQRKIEALIKRGLLSSYVSNDKHPKNDRGRERAPEAKRDGQPTAGIINIIIGDIASGGDSNSGRKQYARQYALASGMPHGKLEDITFGTRDLEGVSLPHDNALVISAIVANFEVNRILVDNGSAANILSQEAFAKMEISSQQLKAVKTPLQGFGGGVITPEGVVELPLTLGSGQKQVTEMTSFQVVRVLMAYNAILGRPLLNKIKAIVSTFHLAMKFPTSNGVGVVRGDQIAAR
ncbi:uncharacterized protein LOC111398189 [Olea europaea var. sylvestris]|uniref:uncharacterized protein LOC111398189 n=1 Tax=Olea europaea var. sylvestris TaxID=158386 RepID=UPI000C1D75CB|nr:uncharacterized protein LOC111398189 [Olea europaea var. sylvestris]